MVKGIETIIAMIPKGGKYAKSVVNFVHKVPENWGKFKEAIKQIENILKQGKLKLDGKQKTIFETNKNILKNHEKVTKKVEVPPPVKKPEDYFKGWTPNVITGGKGRNVPPARLYTKEMERIDDELDELVFGNKYDMFSTADKAALFKQLQANMKKLIDKAMKDDLATLSLSEINKKSHALQKRIREIADNPNIEGTVYSGPKRDMIEVIYKEREPLDKARQVITKRNSELKYGKKYPVLDPENDAFIVLGLDERGNPIKISRFTGKFSATKDSKTGDLTSAEGTSFYDKWNAKTGTFRKEGEEVFHETLNREGKVIMSNPEYKLPKTQRLDIQTEFYTDLSTRDLFKKGYKLKDIDMIVKGRKVREYLDKTKSKDTSISMHEQTSTNEIGAVMEDLYHQGDDIYKMSIEEWVKKIPEYFAEGGYVPGFATGGVSNLFRKKFKKGTYRDRLQRDYESLTTGADWMRTAPPKWWLFPEKYGKNRDDAMTFFKERFMYGDLDPIPTPWEAIKKSPELVKFMKWLEERKGHATGGVSNLFRKRQGYRSGKAVELVTKLPEFLKFVDGLLIKASNQIRQGLGKWKGLDIKQKIVQHDNLTKLVTEFQKTKKFDPKMNEYFGIDAEKAFIEAQAKVEKAYLDKGITEGAAEQIKNLKLAKSDRYVAPVKKTRTMDDLVEDAYEEIAGGSGFSGDIKYDADILAEQIATLGGKIYDDLVGFQKAGIYDLAYTRMAKNLKSKMDFKKNLKDLEQKIELQMFDPKGKKGNAAGGLIDGYATGGVSNLFRRR